MHPSHRLSTLALALTSLLAAAPSAHAQSAASDAYTYLGLGVGQSRARIEEGRIRDNLLGSGLTTTGIRHDERDTAYKVFGGYQFNRNWALELGYFKLGDFGFDAATTPTGSLNGQFRVQGGNLDVVGTLPLGSRWSALGRVGAQFARTRSTLAGTGAVTVANPTPSERETNLKLGLGLQFEISPQMWLRGEVERLRINDAVGHRSQVAVYTVSLVFPLGRAAEPVRTGWAPPAAAPAPRATAITPAPVVAVVRPAPDRRRVSYTAESMFDFDDSALRAEGRAALDGFVAELAGARFDAITVQGHADRLGTAEYNQTLSLARAEAVKAYLATNGGIDPSRIRTEGRSQSEPVTLPEACKGRLSAAVIDCLQPDRRVEIEVSGTR